MTAELQAALDEYSQAVKGFVIIAGSMIAKAQEKE